MFASFRTAMLVALFCTVSSAHATEPLITKGFRDDFTTPHLNVGRWYVSDGWTNGPHQDCTWSRRAVTLADGALVLSHIPADGAVPALCGEVQLRGFIRYGTIEARIRTPRASGLNASVFTFTGPVHGTRHDEIDIEILTRHPDRADYNTFVDGKPMNGGNAPAQPPFDTAFHDVAIQWGPDAIVWFQDGQEVHRTPPDAVLPDLPQKLMMSFWSTTTLTDWMGRQQPRRGPLHYTIDWIAYTPPGERCLFKGSVTC